MQSWRGDVTTPSSDAWGETATPHSSPPPTIRRQDSAKIRTSLASVSESVFGSPPPPPPSKDARQSVPSSPRSMVHQRARSPLSFTSDAFATGERSAPDRVNGGQESTAPSESTSQTPSLISDTSTSRGVR